MSGLRLHRLLDAVELSVFFKVPIPNDGARGGGFVQQADAYTLGVAVTQSWDLSG